MNPGNEINEDLLAKSAIIVSFYTKIYSGLQATGLNKELAAQVASDLTCSAITTLISPWEDD